MLLKQKIKELYRNQVLYVFLLSLSFFDIQKKMFPSIKAALSDSPLTFLKYSSSKEILAVPDCLTPEP